MKEYIDLETNTVMMTPPKPRNKQFASFQSPQNIPSVSPILKLFIKNKYNNAKEEVFVSDFAECLYDNNNDEDSSSAPSQNVNSVNKQQSETEKEVPFLFEIQQSIKNLDLDAEDKVKLVKKNSRDDTCQNSFSLSGRGSFGSAPEANSQTGAASYPNMDYYKMANGRPSNPTQ